MRNCSAESERELLPLSWLAQYGYCPRRCALLALDQVWNENEFTAEGRAQHQRVRAGHRLIRAHRQQLWVVGPQRRYGYDMLIHRRYALLSTLSMMKRGRRFVSL